MSVKVSNAVWHQKLYTGNKLLLLVKVADNVNDDGVGYPGNEYLTDMLGLTEQHIRRLFIQLEADGQIWRVPGNGRGNKSMVLMTIGLDQATITSRLIQYFDMPPKVAENVALSIEEKRGTFLSKRGTSKTRKGNKKRIKGNMVERKIGLTINHIQPSLSNTESANAPLALLQDDQFYAVNVALQEINPIPVLPSDVPNGYIAIEGAKLKTEDYQHFKVMVLNPIPPSSGAPPLPLSGDEKPAKPADPPSTRKPWSDLTDAMHNAIPARYRPPGKPHYAKNSAPAEALYNDGFTPDRVAAYVKDVYEKDTWYNGQKDGTPKIITMHTVKTNIKAYEASLNGGIDGRQDVGPNDLRRETSAENEGVQDESNGHESSGTPRSNPFTATIDPNDPRAALIDAQNRHFAKMRNLRGNGMGNT